MDPVTYAILHDAMMGWWLACYDIYPNPMRKAVKNALRDWNR
jgi:hypothetical protein